MLKVDKENRKKRKLICQWMIISLIDLNLVDFYTHALIGFQAYSKHNSKIIFQSNEAQAHFSRVVNVVLSAKLVESHLPSVG